MCKFASIIHCAALWRIAFLAMLIIRSVKRSLLLIFLTPVLLLPNFVCRADESARCISSFPTDGAMRVLVVLAQYQNVSFSTPDAAMYFDRMLNEEGFTDNGARGSARDYFMAQSGGRFDVVFDVVGPVTLSQRRSYYGADSGSVPGNDVHADVMVTESLALLGDNIDMSAYDRDGDGLIDNVFVIYAGMDQAAGAPSEAVWGHAGAVLDAAGDPHMQYGDKTLRDYVCVSELKADGSPTAIGVFCKELVHTLGVPYLNATVAPLSCTPGAWSLMDTGYLNGGGRCPAGLSAFELYTLGWCAPRVLGAPSSELLRPLSEGGVSYVVPASNPDEFFLLENRQQSGWDAALPYHGLIVWHVDYDSYVWEQDVLNNNSHHQYVDLLEASGVANNLSQQTLNGYPFPGAAGVGAFSLLCWEGREVAELSEVRETGGFISFDYNGGSAAASVPVVSMFDISDKGVLTLTWQDVAGAEDYLVDIQMADGTPVRGYRDFSTAGATSFEADGLWSHTEYLASVRAVRAGVVSEPSETVSATAPEISMEYQRPLATGAGGADGQTVLSWMAMGDAAAYLLTIEIPAENEPLVIKTGFGDSKGFCLPSGWSWNGDIFGDDTPAYVGDSAPSLRFSSSSHVLVTELFDEALTSVSFWLRSAAATGSSTLVVGGRQTPSSEWMTLSEIVMLDQAKNGVTFHVDPCGARQLRFAYDKDAGNAALDDVELHTTRSTYAPIPDFTRYDAGLSTELRLDRAFGDNTYFFIEAVDASGAVSMASDRVPVPAQSGVSMPEAAAFDNDAAEYFNLQGLRVDSPSRGLYIRRAAGRVEKVYIP